MSGRRRALLMGNAIYEADRKLPNLACPLNDVDGLARVLGDVALGGFETPLVLRDANGSEARREIIAFLREARPDDTVLFYYSGHGKLDRSLNLHLCTRDSEVDYIEATAVPIHFVRDQMRTCRAQKRVVMLDCCYSGAATGFRARSSVDDQLRLANQGSGTYLLTSSSSIETSEEKEGDLYGVFTKHVLEGLQSGAADHDGRGVVTMDDLYDYVVEAVSAEGSPQRPNREVDGHGDIIIARSAKDSRENRARTAAEFLFARVASNDLDDEIATAIVKTARKHPSEHTPQEVVLDRALDQLLAKRITLSTLVVTYWRSINPTDQLTSKTVHVSRERSKSPSRAELSDQKDPQSFSEVSNAGEPAHLNQHITKMGELSQVLSEHKPLLWARFLTPLTVLIVEFLCISLSSINFPTSVLASFTILFSITSLGVLGWNVMKNAEMLGVWGWIINCTSVFVSLIILYNTLIGF